jgi:hypothetical protein
MKIPNWYLPMFPVLRIIFHPTLLVGLITSSFCYFVYTHYQDRIISYSSLEKYLHERDWKNADKETSRLINKLILISIDREHFWGASKLDFGAAARHKLMLSENLPCDILTKIDDLWLKHSDNHYGFTPQSNIANALFFNKYSFNKISNIDDDIFIAKVRFDRLKNQNIYKEADEFSKHIGMLPSNLWFQENSPYYRSPVLLIKNYKLCIK